jgi:3-methyladenine DNA glycosylase AlkD
MWLNRTAILFQLHYKQKTTEALLYSFIINHAKSQEFFIQKAIGWALREYSKTNKTSVVEFIHNHDLKPLSKREGLKWLNKQASNHN